VHSKAEFDKVLSSARSKQLVVVDFAATWCGPCQQIAPKFAAMASQMPHVKFVKVTPPLPAPPATERELHAPTHVALALAASRLARTARVARRLATLGRRWWLVDIFACE
jgi:thiol-disulfide isomerase/thioredoxin